MSDSLAGKVVIVTGGGTGIGEAICLKVAREGARVVVNGLPGDPIEDVVAAIERDGGEATAFEGDVSIEELALACIDTALAQYGQLDVLINNAGVLLVASETDDMPVDRFDEHLRCNVRSAFLMTKYALPHLRRTHGNIISAGSAAGVNGQPGNTTTAARRASCTPSRRASRSSRRATACAPTACAPARSTPRGRTRRPGRWMPRSRRG